MFDDEKNTLPIEFHDVYDDTIEHIEHKELAVNAVMELVTYFR